MRQAIQYVNTVIMRDANKIAYTVSDKAPSTELELFGNTGGLIIWNGASDCTIFGDIKVNYGFRALHDTLHLKTGMGFGVDAEIELGRIQASQYDSDLMRELVFAEVSLQASYFKTNGIFVPDQYSFTLNHLRKTGVLTK